VDLHGKHLGVANNTALDVPTALSQHTGHFPTRRLAYDNSRFQGPAPFSANDSTGAIQGPRDHHLVEERFNPCAQRPARDRRDPFQLHQHPQFGAEQQMRTLQRSWAVKEGMSQRGEDQNLISSVECLHRGAWGESSAKRRTAHPILTSQPPARRPRKDPPLRDLGYGPGANFGGDEKGTHPRKRLRFEEGKPPTSGSLRLAKRLPPTTWYSGVNMGLPRSCFVWSSTVEFTLHHLSPLLVLVGICVWDWGGADRQCHIRHSGGSGAKVTEAARVLAETSC